MTKPAGASLRPWAAPPRYHRTTRSAISSTACPDASPSRSTCVATAHGWPADHQPCELRRGSTIAPVGKDASIRRISSG